MQNKTYLRESFKNGYLLRWQKMPVTVYIAPMKFYSKEGQDYKYRDMVLRALSEWERASLGKVSFTIVDKLMDSQINVDWKRVDRKALGHCIFNFDTRNRLFGAEVQIGLSDGIVHQQYDTESEVYHTILHEIGHSIGLQHSPYDTDIMYTPHRYGITSLSQGDKLSVRWLYKLPLGISISEVASQLKVQSNDIDDIIEKFTDRHEPSEFEKVKNEVQSSKKDLLQEAQNIGDLKRYNVALQNISISPEVRNFLLNKKNI